MGQALFSRPRTWKDHSQGCAKRRDSGLTESVLVRSDRKGTCVLQGGANNCRAEWAGLCESIGQSGMAQAGPATYWTGNGSHRSSLQNRTIPHDTIAGRVLAGLAGDLSGSISWALGNESHRHINRSPLAMRSRLSRQRCGEGSRRMTAGLFILNPIPETRLNPKPISASLSLVSAEETFRVAKSIGGIQLKAAKWFSTVDIRDRGTIRRFRQIRVLREKGWQPAISESLHTQGCSRTK